MDFLGRIAFLILVQVGAIGAHQQIICSESQFVLIQLLFQIL